MDNTLSFLPTNLKVRTRSITGWKEKLTSKERPTSALLNVSDSFSVVQKVFYVKESVYPYNCYPE